MGLLNFVPLVLALVLLAPVALAPVSTTAYRTVTRVSLQTFGTYVRDSGRRRNRREEVLRAAHVGETYRLYASKTWVYGTLAAISGSILGVYVAGLVLATLSVSPTVLRSELPTKLDFLADLVVVPSLSIGHLFVLLLFSSATVGLLGGRLTYWLRWELPAYEGNTRARKIDSSLSRTVAFTYALSRSGMGMPDIMRILARNRDVYGEAAEEIAVGVKAMDLFGLDVLTAIRQMSRQSPSEKFEDFGENLASVLQSGRSLPSYLSEQYERYQRDAKAEQEAFLELLSVLAEGYVSLFVVGPLLLITILVIMGLMGIADTLRFLYLTAYLLIPLGNVGFVVYLDSITESLHISRENRTAPMATVPTVRRVSDPDAGRTVSDGGTTVSNAERLAAYDKFENVRTALTEPLRTVRENPDALLYLTVPLALLSIVVRILPDLAAGTATIPSADDVVVQAALFVLGTYAVVQWNNRRRLKAIEAAIPDMLDRLASVNEAGMTVVESFRRVTKGDLGALNEELARMERDIEWGTDTATALRRFEDRIDTPTVTRVVSLVTNAMRASGDIGRVLRIAADDAQESKRLQRQREDEMMTYLIIIYLSFLIFLVIIGTLSAILVPALQNLPSGNAAGSPVTIGGLGNISTVNIHAYTVVFFHTALVQAVFSGFVAGKMGEGKVRDGAKHATAMLAIAYVAFLVIDFVVFS
ncbi:MULTISPECIES: type II secretion system F family protein [unclassified Haladaptatus]|uniref:type II secretion system F family protein n=1 Tax=unclassified Haladaptatus TaxID=2622732 RepID=UPI00209BED19|nr:MULTISPECIES: type II secretion system F family protein [unclassified Haladaptatus]MCO8247012.1 type II secretion system F family protein [Haladaptatus sp. AB643]MCO8254605.1 type II secretion system F family protein [Haladaptatus sp. AB618]